MGAWGRGREEASGQREQHEQWPGGWLLVAWAPPFLTWWWGPALLHFYGVQGECFTDRHGVSGQDMSLWHRENEVTRPETLESYE